MKYIVILAAALLSSCTLEVDTAGNKKFGFDPTPALKEYGDYYVNRDK